MRGVKTNVPFLMNVLKNSTFLAGKCDTFFIDSTPSLFDIEVPEDRASKMLSYIGERILEEDRLPKPAGHRCPSALYQRARSRKAASKAVG